MHNRNKSRGKNILTDVMAKCPYPFALLYKSPFFVAKLNLLRCFKKAEPYLGGVLLDIGCGQKPFIKYIKSEKYYGMDYTVDLTPHICGDVLNIPVKPEQIDSAICSEVIEHTPEPEMVIQEIYRIMKKGGRLYLTAPMLWYLHYVPHDYFRYTKYGLAYLLEKNKFKIIWIKRYGGLNYFIANRISETLYRCLMKLLSVMRMGLQNRSRISLILLAPVQIILYLYATTFDFFNKRDSAGYALLAQKK